MRALLYLTKRSMINNLKKAVKKPLTLLVVLACAAYAVFLAVMLAELAVQMKFDSAKGMVIILTVWSLYLFFAEFYVICIQKRNSLPPGTCTFYLQCACGSKGRANPWSLDELSEQCGVLSDIYYRRNYSF
mgnify:CR=1 FL=1